MARAQETFTAEEIKVFSGSSPSELVGCHLHKLVQVMHLCKFIPSFFSFTFFLFLHYSEMDKGASATLATPVTPGTETARMASPATSVEEISPYWKR